MSNFGYTDVESSLVRSQIVNGDYDDETHRDYVDDLVSLERYIRRGPRGFAGAKQYHVLRDRHPVAHDAIRREVDPEGRAEARRRDGNRTDADEVVRTTVRRAARKKRTEWERAAAAFVD